MEGFKDIEFFQIPIEWNSVKLGSEKPLVLEEIRNGLTISQNKDGSNYKVSRIETISESIIDETRVRYISEITKEKLEKYLIKKGDILFSHINSDPHLGKTAIAKKDYDDLLHGMNLLLFRANRSIIEPEYLNYIFNLYRQIGIFIRIRSRAVNQSSINQNKLKNLEIPLPELLEQRKIAHVLSTIQKAIEQQDKLIRTTTELKKALMQKLFTEGTRGEPQKETEIGLVPESWELNTIENIILGKFQNGAFVQNPSKGKGLLFANVVDMYRDIFLDLTQLERIEVNQNNVSQYILEEDDVLFVRSSLKREGIGQNCIAKNLSEVVFYDCHLIKVKPDTCRVLPAFLSYYFISSLGKEELIKRSKTTTMTTINQKSLGSALIPLPSIEMQREIVDSLLKIDEKIKIDTKRKKSLTDLFKTLLHELMTGQLRVHELDFELIQQHTDESG